MIFQYLYPTTSLEIGASTPNLQTKAPTRVTRATNNLIFLNDFLTEITFDLSLALDENESQRKEFLRNIQSTLKPWRKSFKKFHVVLNLNNNLVVNVNVKQKKWFELTKNGLKNFALGILDFGVDVLLFKNSDLIFFNQDSKGIFQEIPSSRLGLFINETALTTLEANLNLGLGAIFSTFIVNAAENPKNLLSLTNKFKDFKFLANVEEYEQAMEILGLGVDVVVTFKDRVRGIQPDVQAETLIDEVSLMTFHLNTDRPDGLYTTLVVDTQNTALGICYSSLSSIRESVHTMTGVYMSRTRGLWYKGATSGAKQELKTIDIDCDNDALRFTVVQKGKGFCHKETRTCWGPDRGITALYRTIQSRLSQAPSNSYTHRLFTTPKLLNAKIMEEAEELCDAAGEEEVGWEAADLIYFAMVKCVSSGVGIDEIEAFLENRTRMITRRKGDAKVDLDIKGVSNSNPVSVPVAISVDSMGVSERKALLQRPIINTTDIMNRVRPIMQQVREKGDAALRELTLKYDGVKLTDVVMKAPFSEAAMQLDDKVKKAIDVSFANILKFHQKQMDAEQPLVVETMPGVVCSRFARAIETVGLYVPGGTAVLPSTTLMLGIPAMVAGCDKIVVATPPGKDGKVSAEVLYVASKIGAKMVVLAGGAQAVAAMAYGTETVPKVDKICGPGNQYVTAAKMIAQSDSEALVSIDMPAGPSELLVIADFDAVKKYVVSDLLSQAEHGGDSQVVLVLVGVNDSDSLSGVVEEYQLEMERQASVLPRAEIVKISISKSYIVCIDTMEEAIDFSNSYAPEHLILNVNQAEKYVEKVMNAGSVFVGAYSPESCGDYSSGTNHTLPTYGYSRMYSGVNTQTFIKHITSQYLTKEGLDGIGDAVTTLARVEGLEAHANAVAVRLNDIRKKN